MQEGGDVAGLVQVAAAFYKVRTHDELPRRTRLRPR